MNHYAAREILVDGKGVGRWRFTVANKRTGVYAVGPCANDCPGHATPEEACEHFRQGLLNSAIFRGPTEQTQKPDTQERCEFPGCEEWADGIADVPTQILTYSLCGKHRNRESLDKVMPKIGVIWGTV